VAISLPNETLLSRPVCRASLAMTVRANEDTREPISLSRTLFIIQILSILFIDVNSLPSSSNWVRARGRALVAGIRPLHLTH